MSTKNLGGAISIQIRCSACEKTMTFRSDPSMTIKHQLVAACHIAGIRFAKFKRLSVALGILIQFLEPRVIAFTNANAN